MEPIIKVSAIVTTYNRASLLAERSLPSLLSQASMGLHEVIVVDDCSTDNTEEVVKEFQKQYSGIVYHKHPENIGLASARNTGVFLAKGEYIVFLDDDDFLLPFVLEIGTYVLDKYKDKHNLVKNKKG